MRTPVLKNVDVIATLRAIMDANTESYKSDFDYDAKTLKTVAKNPECKNRTFFWMSRNCGTWLFKEYDIFLKTSAAYNTWLCYYEQDMGEHPVAVNVVVDCYKDGIVWGDIYLLNFSRICGDIKKSAVSADYTDIAYEKGIVRVPVSKSIVPEHPKYGKFVSYQVIPNDEQSYGMFLWEQKKQRSSAKVNMEVDIHTFAKLMGLPLSTS